MSAAPHELEVRLEHLERETRRLKVLALLVALAAALLALGYTARSVPAVAQGTTIVAERFLLVDQQGRTRAVLETDSLGPRLALQNPDAPDDFSRDLASLRLAEQTALLVLRGPETVGPGGSVTLRAHPSGAVLSLRSAPRVQENVLIMTTGDGAGLMAITDEAGQTLWMAP